MAIRGNIAVICMASALWAGQAFGLTPLPQPCSYEGTKVDGAEIVNSSREDNEFVVYITETRAERVVYYLEHCPSGKILRAKSGPEALPVDHPRSAQTLWDTMLAALESDAPVTLKQLQGQLRAHGLQTRRYTSKNESCACNAYAPDTRGRKRPYRKVTQ